MNHTAILRRLFNERSASGPGAAVNLGNVRYVPKATGHTPGAWMVWDRQDERFISEKEARDLGERLLEATLVN